MTAWLAFAVGGVASYLMRASFILFLSDRRLPAPLERSLRYVGPAVFAAIVLPATLGEAGLSRLTEPDARLVALVVGGVVMWKTRNMATTLALGMVALWLLQWLGA